MNVAILDLETSKKPILKPWMKGSFLSTIGLRMYLEDGDSYYKEWVWYHSEMPGIGEQDRLNITFEIQDEIDKLGPTGILANHNVKFDMNWLKTINVDLSNTRLWCTQQAEYMLSGQDKIKCGPGKLQRLGEICNRRGIPTKTDVVKTYWDAGVDTDKIPLRILLPYQKNDVDITAQLFKEQWSEIKSQQNLMKLVRLRCDVLQSITEIELNGMPFDRPLAERLVEEFGQELEINTAELRTYFGHADINLASGPELSACLYGGKLKRERYEPEIYTRNCTLKEPYDFTYRSGPRKGVTIVKYKNRVVKELICKKRKVIYEIPVNGVGFTPPEKSECIRDGKPTGVFPCNKDVLKNLRCNNKGGSSIGTKRRVLELLLHRSKIAQFNKTFIGEKEGTGLFFQADQNEDGFLHPNYNTTIASTGRLTSSGPNGQNFPRAKEDEDGFTNPLKNCFIPSRPGGLILAGDMSQLEWRIGAWLSQDPVAMAEIRSGVDQHLANAVEFFGDAKYRQEAKIMTFRLLYGGGAYAFYMDPTMPNFTLIKWTNIVEMYNRKYIVLTNWQQMNISRVSQDNGYLYSPTGRIYKIPMAEHKKHKGVWTYVDTCIKNYPVQGTATGDIMPLAMHVLWKRMQADPGLYMSSFWMGQVHDSILFDTIRVEVERLAKLIITTFEDLPGIISSYWGVDFNLPLTGECEWGPNYGTVTNKLKHEGGLWLT